MERDELQQQNDRLLATLSNLANHYGSLAVKAAELEVMLREAEAKNQLLLSKNQELTEALENDRKGGVPNEWEVKHP